MKTDHKSNRFVELEGLRGIAALAVVVFHAIALFYAQMAYGPSVAAPVQHMRLEDNLYATPIAALWSGTFAVAIFFVLSGFVLSVGYLQPRKRMQIERIAIKRYVRLVIPVFVSVFACYLLMKLDLNSMQAAASIIHSETLAKAWAFDPSILTVLKDSLVGVFVGGATSYNVVLWTMTIEFIGSFIVFATLLLFSSSRYRWLAYGALVIATFNTWFMAFAVGMMLADMYSHGYLRQQRRSIVAVGALGAAALYLGGYPYGEDLSGTAYGLLQALPLGAVDYRMLSLTVGAMLLVGVVLCTEQFASVLRRRYIYLLGKYSFSLYLVHLPILWTVTLGIFVGLYEILGYNKAVVVSLLLTIPVIWTATVVFERYVDRRAVALSSFWADVYLGKRDFALASRLAKARRSVRTAMVKVRKQFTPPADVVLENEVE